MVGGRLNVEWPQRLRRRVSSVAPRVPRQVGGARRLQPDPRGAHPERPRYVAGDLHRRSIRGGGVHLGGRAKGFEDFSLGPLDGGGLGNDGVCAMRGGRIEPTRDACDANRSGDLDLSQSRFALQAFGLYPQDRDIEEKVEELGLQLPLSKPAFRKVAAAMETSGCARGLHAVPYAWRGLALKQVKALHAGPTEII